jgi:hypothetical protein
VNYLCDGIVSIVGDMISDDAFESVTNISKLGIQESIFGDLGQHGQNGMVEEAETYSYAPALRFSYSLSVRALCVLGSKLDQNHNFRGEVYCYPGRYEVVRRIVGPCGISACLRYEAEAWNARENGVNDFCLR